MGAAVTSAVSGDPRKGQFIEAMSRGVSMVNVVTTDGASGRCGATVSAMSPVSADMVPPTLLVCMNQSSSTGPAIMRNGVFCLNILHESQHGVADCFADRVKTDSGDKFDCASWSRSEAGCWRLNNALASFDCRLLKAELVGTHYIIIGSAEAISCRPDSRALLYGGRNYCAAAPLAKNSPAKAAAGETAEAAPR